MSTAISGARIRKGLGRSIPSHRISVSDAFRSVVVHPDSLHEVAETVSFAAREGVPVFPMSSTAQPITLDQWHIRLSLSRLSAITDYSPDSGLVCVQGGVNMAYLAEWLQEKDHTLAVASDFAEDLELWEYLLSPHSGRFGPLYGSKWDQVFALKAVLPSGKPFANSLAPARATGPDFAQVLLMTAGRFGIPLEIYLRIQRLPPRRMYLAFELDDLAASLDTAWAIARDITPVYLELGATLSGDGSLPSRFMLVELWGEGRRLSVKRELVRKAIGDLGRHLDLGPEALAAATSSPGLKPRDCAHLFLHRKDLGRAVGQLLDRCCDSGQLRLRGFLDNQVCLSTDVHTLDQARLDFGGVRTVYSSDDGSELLSEVADQLDPGGVFARIPQLWERS